MTMARLRVADRLLLQTLFRLPGNVTLQDAAVEPYGEDSAMLALTVDMPDAPPDAVSVDIAYTRRMDLPDPLQVTGYRWFREDGTEITGDVP